MSTWSPTEFAALYQAWREAIDTPLSERNKISHEVFRRFTVLVGGSTARSEGSVSFKQGSLKNMVRLVMAFNDRDKWFAFSLEQKKIWFKMVNRKSYKFIDIDRPMFRTVEQLIQLQAASTNMRVTSASGDRFGILNNTSLRVTLRRNTVTGAWKTRGFPPLLSQVLPSPELPAAASSQLPSLPLPLAQRQQVAAFLPAALRAPVAHPPARAPAREFPFPERARDSRSIFEHEGVGHSLTHVGSIFAPRSANPRPIFPTSLGQPNANSQDQLTRPSKRNDVIVFDDGDYDSGSSTESDSDAEMWEESEEAAAHLRHLESITPAPVAPPAAAALPRNSNGNANSFLSMPNNNNRALPPVALSAQHQKRSRAPVSPIFESPAYKKQKIDPELMMVVNILEKQAQELKTLIAEVREERESDLQQRAKEFNEKIARANEIQQIVETIKVEAEIRQKEHEQRQLHQEERSRMVEEIKLLEEERQKFEQERKVEEEARKTMLEQIELDREECRKAQEQRDTERQERETLLKQIQQDREDRQRSQAERKKVLEQLEQIQKSKPVPINSNNKKERERVVEMSKNRDRENASKQAEQENKRPATPSGKDSAAKAPSKPAAASVAADKGYYKQTKEDFHKARQHHRSGRPFDDKKARMKKFSSKATASSPASVSNREKKKSERMPRKRGSKATPSAKWSAPEIAAMLAAWRDALETPKYRGFTVRTHMFDQFVERCGGATPRALASVCFKRETLRNMAEIIGEYHASVEGQQQQQQTEKKKEIAPAGAASGGDTAGPTRDLKWFSLSVAERKDWFEEHNSRSYTYLDVDVDTFLEVKQLQEMAQQYEYPKSKNSPRVKLQRLKEENEGDWHVVRGRAAMSSQAAVDLAAALIARPAEKSMQLPAAAAVESPASPSGSEQRSVQDQTPAANTVASVTPGTVSVINDANQYGSETQEEDESSLDSHRYYHHHHGGDDGSSTESDSDVGVWEEDEDHDFTADDTEKEGKEENNEIDAPEVAVCSSEDVTDHEKDDGAADGATSQSNNETVAPNAAVRSSEGVEEHSATAAVPAQTLRINHNVLQAEEATVRAQEEKSSISPIEASGSVKIAAVVKDAQPRPRRLAESDTMGSHELERQLAVDRDLLKIVQNLDTHAEHLKFLQNQAKHAKTLDQKTRQRDLERMRRLDKIALELETQMKNVLAEQNTYRDERNLADVTRSIRFMEQLKEMRTEGRDQRHLLVSQIMTMQTQWEKRDTERQKEAKELKLEIARLEKKANERDDMLTALKGDLAEMRRLMVATAANNEMTQTSTQQDHATVRDLVRGPPATEDKSGKHQIQNVMSEDPGRDRKRRRAVLTEVTEAEIKEPEKRKVLAEKKLQPREQSPKRVTARQSSIIKTKQSPDLVTVPRARNAPTGQDTVPAQVPRPTATSINAKSANKAKSSDQPVTSQNLAQSTSTKESTQRSTPQSQMDVGNTGKESNVAEEKRGANQPKKLVIAELEQHRKRKRTVQAVEAKAQVKEPEKRMVLAEKKLHQREPSPKRVTARKFNAVVATQSSEPEKTPRERKAPRDQNITPIQPATPLNAKSTNPAQQSKDLPAKIQKSPPPSVAEPEPVPHDALPIPTYRTRGSRSRMKENAI